MRKNILVGLLVICLVALLAGGTYAWFTAQDDTTNTLTAGTVKIEINEDYDPVIAWQPGDVNTKAKQVSVKSQGNKRTYVRVSLTPVWGHEDDGGNFVAEPSLPVDNVELIFDEDYDYNWVYSDGWYYYKHILAAGGETPLLLSSVTLDENTGPEYEGKVLQIVVSAEAVQASHDAYKDVWGLTALPAGVDPWTP